MTLWIKEQLAPAMIGARYRRNGTARRMKKGAAARPGALSVRDRANRGSGRRRHLDRIVGGISLGAGAAAPAARRGRRLIAAVVAGGDGRRQHGGVQRARRLFRFLAAAARAANAALILIDIIGLGGGDIGPVFGLLGLAVTTRLFVIAAILAIAAMALIVAARAIVTLIAALARVELVAFVGVIAVVAIVAARALLLKAGAALAQHAEIMVRELEVIFGVHAITGHLGVARQILVFLVKLLGIAARAIVDAVVVAARTPRIALRPLAAATATAATLTIVDQRMSSTSPKNVSVCGFLFLHLVPSACARP